MVVEGETAQRSRVSGTALDKACALPQRTRMSARIDLHLRVFLLALPIFAFTSSLMIACGSSVDDSTSAGSNLGYGYGYGK
jgi:hypothetical protein